MDQLGSDKMDVRLGSIYALHRIANDSPQDRITVAEVLAAFVRGHAPWPPNLPGQYVEDAPLNKVPALPIRAQDVQAALTTLATDQLWFTERPRRLRSVDLRKADLREAALKSADLSGADLREADLLMADLRWANLGSARLQGANLSSVRLEGAQLLYAHVERPDLSDPRLAKEREARLKMAEQWSEPDLLPEDEGTDLTYANLDGAMLWGTDLQGANLQNATLKGATLWGADLREADLRDAILQDAHLNGPPHGVDLRGADLRGTNLWGTDLSKLPHENLVGAMADGETTWPEDFDKHLSNLLVDPSRSSLQFRD